jgi:hypothetical protein
LQRNKGGEVERESTLEVNIESGGGGVCFIYWCRRTRARGLVCSNVRAERKRLGDKGAVVLGDVVLGDKAGTSVRDDISPVGIAATTTVLKERGPCREERGKRRQ